MRQETDIVHAGDLDEQQFGSLSHPLYLTSTFVLEKVGKDKGYDYSRSGNPTRTALQKELATLEGGSSCRVHGTGIASILTVLHHFKSGDHILVSKDCYGGTFRLIAQKLCQLGLEADFIDFRKIETLHKHLKNNTKALWVESPSNPLLKIIDLKAVGEFSKIHGLTYIVDNTFLSPIGQSPFDFGADLIVHSTTKYINGHCDCTGGAVISNSPFWDERIDWLSNCLGTAQSPFDSWQILRGCKTLKLRYRAQEKSALKIAHWLEKKTWVDKVHYPGLKIHPDFHLAQKQQKGPGAIISFEIQGGREEAVRFVENTKVIRLAESLGGVQSLIEVPALQSHASMTPEARQKAGIGENLIRLSVGLENLEDLKEDLEQAFLKNNKISSSSKSRENTLKGVFA
jgi:cystathionine gamma-synthase